MNRKTLIFTFSGLLVFLMIAVGVVKADIPTPGGAWVTLEPRTGTFEAGDVFQVKVLLDAKEQETDGIDIHYLNYSQGLLEVQDADPASPGVQIEAGALFPNTVKNEVSTEDGKIDFSQITSAGQQFSGSGILATVTFKALSEGTAQVFFDFAEGNTTDCNVASAGQDILGSATGAEFILGETASPPVESLIEPPVESEPPAPAEPPIVSNGEDTAVNGWGIASSKTVLYAAAPLLVILVVVLLLLRKRRKDVV